VQVSRNLGAEYVENIFSPFLKKKPLTRETDK
jgi:hypothetical protein